MPFKMKEIVEFKGILRVEGSGLRIGGSEDSAGIGETDKPIIRHPITRLPYVPGSSIKGKVRALLESRHCPDTQRSGMPCTCGACLVCQLFGCGSSTKTQSPSRLVFRDCQPTEETQGAWEEAGTSSEVKTEVKIDRNKGIAAGGALRTMERIPAGSNFDFAFSLRHFEGDSLAEYLELVAEGFELLEKHYLGGAGSRGYGEVSLVTAEGESMTAHLRTRAKEAAT